MAELLSCEALEKHRELIDILYDSFKVVDPETKKIFEIADGKPRVTEKFCFERWNRETPCENCVAFAAKNENRSMVKLFSADGRACFVRAIPLAETDPPLTVEFLKDVTDSLLYSTGGSASDSKYILDAVTDLNSMIIRDQLTKLYNRRYLDTRLPADLRAASDRKQPISVVFLDVDDFKHINDTYGHATGDLVLQATARALESAVRSDYDWAARFGGDEFVACLGDADSAAARRIAERILAAVAAASVPFGEETIRFTVSLGIETMQGTERTAEELLQAADRSMYSSKQRGKNRITAG